MTDCPECRQKELELERLRQENEELGEALLRRANQLLHIRRILNGRDDLDRRRHDHHPDAA